MTGAEFGTGALAGLYGYQTTEDDAPISRKLGRMGIGFLAGAGGLKATKGISRTVKVKKQFGEELEDETVEVSESLYDLLGEDGLLMGMVYLKIINYYKLMPKVMKIILAMRFMRLAEKLKKFNN